MAKLKTIIFSLFVMLWPVTFAISINLIDSYVYRIVSRTYTPSGAYWLLLLYAISGLIFAYIASCIRKNCEQKANVVIHVISLVLVVIAAFVYLTYLLGIVNYGSFVVYIDPTLLSLSLGYTLYTATKSIMLYKKHESKRI